jgi:two-component system, NtrC family, sensor kinase
MSEVEAWRRRFEREREARKEAEALLVSRARELHAVNEALSESLAELARAHEVMLEREKLASIGSMFAGVAHELNTPLGVAYTAADVGQQAGVALAAALETTPLEASTLRTQVQRVTRALHFVQRNLERAHEQVRRFKTVAGDQQSNEARVVDVKAFIEDVIATLHPLLRVNQVEVTTDIDVTLEARVVAGGLSQILTNLVVNACTHAFVPDHGAAGRRVHVRASRREESATDTLHLQVSDNGVGMTPEVAAQVYEPFFTTARARGGTGLGMPIVQQLVDRAFGGTIRCETAIGRGTTWWIDLPIDVPTAGIQTLRYAGPESNANVPMTLPTEAPKTSNGGT